LRTDAPALTTLFVSDLHLCAERADKLKLFEQFAEHARRRADEIYILGDLFEVWIGDDSGAPAHRRVVDAIAALSRSGVRVSITRGNRDFLLGQKFCNETGATLLDDFTTITLQGQQTLLTHGDVLCTADTKYQKFRRVVRNPVLQAVFLASPLSWRSRIAQHTQSGTQASMAVKAPEIMDVEQETVVAAMHRYGCSQLIHGHTHRPDTHEFEHQGEVWRRIVLGDWYEQDEVLVCRDAEPRSLRIDEFLSSA
jgi:UDP-2,3-diacylglucosamine hydrolase